MANLVPQEPDEDFGHYHVLGVLGDGRMGRLYLAEQRGIIGCPKILTLRSLDPRLTKEPRFQRLLPTAALAAVSLDHPNVEATYEFEELGGRQFLSTEYLAGESLALILAICTSRSRIPVAITTLMVRQCIEALRCVHDFRDAKGAPLRLVHQDLRPGNIFVCYDGPVKVLGCGLGVLREDVTAIRGESQGGCAYAAPEQLDHGAIDARTDLFSMGIVLWECLTGKQLFGAESIAKSMDAIRSRYVEPPSVFNSDVPPGLDEIVLGALSRDPRRRYQTAQEMSDALQGVLTTFAPQPTTVDVANWIQGLFVSERATLKNQIKDGIAPEVALARLQRLGAPAAGGVKRADSVGPGGERRSQVHSVGATSSSDAPVRETRAPSQLGVRPSPHAPPAPPPTPPPPTSAPFDARGGTQASRASLPLPVPLEQRPVAPRSASIEAEGQLPVTSAPAPARQGSTGRLSPYLTIGVGVAVVAAVGVAVLAFRRGGADPSTSQQEASQGTIQIQTIPPGAQVLIDGDPSGLATPARIGGLHAGRKVEIRVLKSGYKPLRQVIDVPSGGTKSFSFSLEESMGVLRLQGVPPEATTYVDDAVVDFKKPLQLSVGPHRLRVEISDRLLSSMNLDVKAGDQAVRVKTLAGGGQ